MTVGWEQNPDHLRFAEERLGVKFDPRAVTWLTSLDQSGRIIGVVVFSRFTAGNCELTAVSTDVKWLSKGMLLSVVLYVFEQLACRRVTAIVAVGNEKSLNLAQQLGFRIEGRLQDWYSSGDALILGLLRKDCKWLKDKNGQPLSTDSA